MKKMTLGQVIDRLKAVEDRGIRVRTGWDSFHSYSKRFNEVALRTAKDVSVTTMQCTCLEAIGNNMYGAGGGVVQITIDTPVNITMPDDFDDDEIDGLDAARLERILSDFSPVNGYFTDPDTAKLAAKAGWTCVTRGDLVVLMSKYGVYLGTVTPGISPVDFDAFVTHGCKQYSRGFEAGAEKLRADLRGLLGVAAIANRDALD